METINYAQDISQSGTDPEEGTYSEFTFFILLKVIKAIRCHLWQPLGLSIGRSMQQLGNVPEDEAGILSAHLHKVLIEELFYPSQKVSE